VKVQKKKCTTVKETCLKVQHKLLFSRLLKKSSNIDLFLNNSSIKQSPNLIKLLFRTLPCSKCKSFKDKNMSIQGNIFNKDLNIFTKDNQSNT
jgi:hypothetical protein